MTTDISEDLLYRVASAIREANAHEVFGKKAAGFSDREWADLVGSVHEWYPEARAAIDAMGGAA